jgi:hypothetical protein
MSYLILLAKYRAAKTFDQEVFGFDISGECCHEHA